MNLKSVVSNFRKKNVPKNLGFVCLLFVPCFFFFSNLVFLCLLLFESFESRENMAVFSEN